MIQPSFTILPLSAADEPLLAEMMYQAIFVPADGIAPPRSVVEEPALRKYYGDFSSRAGDIGFKAVTGKDELPIGAAWVRLFTGEAPSYGYIDDDTPELSIAVDPAYRGQGVGTLLLEQLFAAVAKAYNAISLSVWTDNPAYRLYQRMGFTVVEAEEGKPDVTMRKVLR